MATPRREHLDDLEFRAWRAFLYAHATVVPTLDRELASAHDLSFNQFEVLTWLARAGRRGLRMSDLASRVVLSPSGVTRAVDQLERRAANDHVLGIRDHFLKHVDRSELEHLATALETILDGEGAPLPPFTTP
jgi:hypothetical protein